MVPILIRTVLIYVFLIVTMRFMGKRQLGELEITDLVTTFMISEIASLPLTDTNIPVHHALIPIISLAGLEVATSSFLLRYPLCKRLLTPRPTLLICHGSPDRRAMKRARLSCEELLSQLRLQGVIDLQTVEYAIMEPNGQISVIQQDTQQSTQKTDLLYLLISDGRINKRNLQSVGRDEVWLKNYLKGHGMRCSEVFMLLSDGKVTRLYPISEKSKKKKGTS